ncbi:glycine/sarcosine/betaine reductase complex component C subunit alpha [Anoxynatronum sibiricum]|uniref:Glycine/sarcosine/betaine reductase complex component C subunit alpha n=1 Tax=Anoxynatronum sibiricum TaxID=210623 RepID=A0ABU9VRN3_9CLOT
MPEQLSVKKIAGEVFYQIADAIESGKFGRNIKIGLTTLGCEVGVENWVKAAEEISDRMDEFEVVLIGPRQQTHLLQFEASTEEEMHRKMETMLDYGMLDACITTHYTYPIGVASVGKMMAPGKGRDFYLATTSGTAALNRSSAMVMNALYGIIVAKTMGIESPRVGILNVDGARQTEKALHQLAANGYPIEFANSVRPESGCIMRGNDVIAGTPDVLVQDSLTGNITMKMCATFMTGGSSESVGAGYGPGIGENYERLAMVISRASGYSVVQNAVLYAVQLAKGKLNQVAKKEFDLAHRAGLQRLIQSLNNDRNGRGTRNSEEVVSPLGEPVTSGISGVDIMDIEQAVKLIWKNGIYAESGMGCTGPILMVNHRNLEKTLVLLRQTGFLVQEEIECV